MRGCLSVIFLLLQSVLFAQTKVSVLTQHNDLQRTGWNNAETILNHSNVNAENFGLVGSFGIDDQLYAQPLVVKNLTIGSFTGSVVFVATVNNSVYAFNADDPSYGVALWQVNLSPAGERAPTIFDLTDPNYGSPCGGGYRDFSGKMGIVGTPAIDTITKTLYVCTKTVNAAGTFFMYINALDLTTGQHKANSPKLMTAEVNGTGDGSVGGKVNYLAKYQNQRPALLLYNNVVYAASASHCDWGPYHGWILAYDATTLEQKYVYNATPNGWAGGFWMAGQGISIGPDGNLYAATGNGTTSGSNTDMGGGRSESVLKLSPDLKMLDWFTPANYNYLDQLDIDYGCDGVLMIPNSSITISGSKEGISYVVDLNDMGRFNPYNAQVKDTLIFNPYREGYVHVHGSPVYANLSTGEYVYGWSESFKIRQYEFKRDQGIFANEYKQGNRNLDNGMPGAMLSISSNGGDTSSAIIWCSFPTSGNANNQVRPGSIAAYRANDVSLGELWSSDLDKTDMVGSFAKFNTTVPVNGKLYVPTFSNTLKIYGLKCEGAAKNLTYAKGTGLTAEYYTNSPSSDGFPENATLKRVDKDVNFNWGNGSPANEISNNVFKARWRGTLQPLVDGQHTFYVTANDGVRLYINENLIIDSWSDKPFTQTSGTASLQKNTVYAIRLEYYANTNASACILQWSAPGICKQNIPSSQLFAITTNCNTKDGDGLLAEYFSDIQPQQDFPANATVTTIEPEINFEWIQGSPPGVSADNFKARWTGYVQAKEDGPHTFYVTTDDGARLWVNDQLIIDAWVNQGATEYSATVNLLQCRKYKIRLEYYEYFGDAVCKLEWSSQSTAREIIPQKSLFSKPDEEHPNTAFALYPNPARTEVKVSLAAGFKTGDNIVMYDILGRMVRKKTISSAGAITETINVYNLAPGTYIVRVFSADKTYTSKLIVEK